MYCLETTAVLVSSELESCCGVAVFDLLNSDLSFEAAQWFLQVQKWSLYLTVLPGTHFSSVFCSLHKALVHFQELENLNSKSLNSHTHTHTHTEAHWH